MKTIQRWDLEGVCEEYADKCPQKMVECDFGDYVLWTDVQAYVQGVLEELRRSLGYVVGEMCEKGSKLR